MRWPARAVDDAQVAFAQADNNYRSAQVHFKALDAVRQDQVHGAAAQVRSAKAHMDSQEAQVAYAHILSPITGIVADRPLNAGEMANPGIPIITVVDISRVVARVNVPQAEASTVKPGQNARLTQPDSKDEIEGKVTVVSPAADANTTTVQIWIEVPNPGERLKPGTAVHASIATEEIKAATVCTGFRHPAGRRGRHGRAHRFRGFNCAPAHGDARRARGQPRPDPRRRHTR